MEEAELEEMRRWIQTALRCCEAIITVVGPEAVMEQIKIIEAQERQDALAMGLGTEDKEEAKA